MDDVEDSKPTDLESLKFNKLCRICGMENSQFMQIYGTEGRDHDIASKINQHFPMISVSEADQLPLQVCYQCASTLLLFHTLYDVCAKTDKQLRDMWRQATGCVDSDDEDPSFGNIDTLGPDSDDDVSDDGGGAKAKASARSMRSVEKRQQRSFDLSTDGFSMSDDENTMDTSNALDPNVVIEEIGGDDDVLGGENSGSGDDKTWNIRLRRRGLGWAKKKTKKINKLVRLSKITPLKKTKAYKGGGPKTCGECGKEFSNGSALVKHALIHKGERKFQCVVCDKAFVRSDHFRRHWRNVHENPSPRVPKTDGKNKIKKADRPVVVNNIMRKTLPKSCQFCDATFFVWKELHAHVDSQHPEFLPYQCEWCQHRYDRLQKVRYHQQKDHPEEYREKHKPFHKACEYCGKEFTMRYFYNLHFQRHLGRLTCVYCMEALPSKEELNRHKNEKHADMLRFVCDLCKKRFATKIGVSDHIVKSHPINKQCCEYCGVYIIRRDRMKDHLLTHTGERPHVCDICGKGFTQKNDMSKHRTLHFREGLFVERKSRTRNVVPRVQPIQSSSPPLPPQPTTRREVPDLQQGYILPGHQMQNAFQTQRMPQMAHQHMRAAQQMPAEMFQQLFSPFMTAREPAQQQDEHARAADMSVQNQWARNIPNYSVPGNHSHFLWSAMNPNLSNQ